MKLFEDVTSDGAQDGVSWPSGLGTFSVIGTLDGASVTLQFSPNNETSWVDIEVYSEPVEVSLGVGWVRASISGSGASTDVSGFLSEFVKSGNH